MQNKNINFTKYKFYPLSNYTVNAEIDETNQTATVKTNEIENTYKYRKIKSKNYFILIKYIPFLLLMMMVTKYELGNSLPEIFFGFIVTLVGILSNLKFNDAISFVIACICFLVTVFISDVINAALIAKYSLIAYLLFQFIFDLSRQYYEVIKDNKVVSYMFIKRDKL